MTNNPRVFISYSWEADNHIKWVKKLTVDLMNSSIEVQLDQYEVYLGSNLETFMKKGLNESDYILCICTNDYIRKVSDPDSGVGKEAAIINAFVNSDHVIPVICKDDKLTLPNFLNGKWYSDFYAKKYSDAFFELIQHIHGVDKALKPRLGKNPFDLAEIEMTLQKTAVLKSTFQNPELVGQVTFNYSSNNGLFVIGTGEYQFDTMWSKASKERIHSYKDGENISSLGIIKTSGSMLDKPTLIKALAGIDFTARVRSPAVGDAIVWINTSKKMAMCIIAKICDDTRGDKDDLVSFDYKIYL